MHVYCMFTALSCLNNGSILDNVGEMESRCILVDRRIWRGLGCGTVDRPNSDL